MGDLYAFAIAVSFLPPSGGNISASFRRRVRLRSLPQPVGSSLSSRGRSTRRSLILGYVEKTPILMLKA
jgi:hypothetical protein